MRQYLKGIDHCCVLTSELDRARDEFTRLGFTVSERGMHPAEMGTGNHTVMLENDYVELLGVLQSTEFNRDMCDLLDTRGKGLAAIALRATDVAGAIAEVRAGGLVASEPHDVRRPVTLPDGSEVEASFTIATFPEVATSHARLFCSQAHTPEYTWVPSLTVHANTAWGIDHLTLLAPDPKDLALEVAQLFDSEPLVIEDEVVVVPTGGTPIICSTAAALAARHPGVDLSELIDCGPAALSIKVRDAGVAADWLRRSGVPFVTTPRGLTIRPQNACGVLLVLREASADESADAALATLHT